MRYELATGSGLSKIIDNGKRIVLVGHSNLLGMKQAVATMNANPDIPYCSLCFNPINDTVVVTTEGHNFHQECKKTVDIRGMLDI